MIITLSLFIAGCSVNSLILGFLYKNIDDKIYQRIKEYAEFSPQQKSEIKQATKEFKAWHKQAELPKYAQLLETITQQIEQNKLDLSAIQNNIDEVRTYSKTLFFNSPIYQNTNFYQELTDAQISQIQQHFAQQDAEFDQWLKETKNQAKDRLQRIEKNLQRIFDIKLSKPQSAIIEMGLNKMQFNPEFRHRLVQNWRSSLIELLKQRTDSDFAAKLKQHLDQYPVLLQQADPKRYQQNQTTLASTIETLIKALEQQQKLRLVTKLTEFKDSILKIHRS